MNFKAYKQASENVLSLSFRPQQGLIIMNQKRSARKYQLNKFPSPTGVNYYEFMMSLTVKVMDFLKFPSPTGVNYYEFYGMQEAKEVKDLKMFPSPTGVNYYELYEKSSVSKEERVSVPNRG